MIFSFSEPHRIGSICGVPCDQCGEEESQLLGTFGEELDPVPMFIIREATEEEWFNDVFAAGNTAPYHDPEAKYFYLVSVD